MVCPPIIIWHEPFLIKIPYHIIHKLEKLHFHFLQGHLVCSPCIWNMSWLVTNCTNSNTPSLNSFAQGLLASNLWYIHLRFSGISIDTNYQQQISIKKRQEVRKYNHEMKWFGSIQWSVFMQPHKRHTIIVFAWKLKQSS